MSRGNSAGGLQQQVSIRTAPDLLKTKPIQYQHDPEEGDKLTITLPKVPTTAPVRYYYIVVVPVTPATLRRWENPEDMDLDEMDALPDTFPLGDEKKYNGFYNKPLHGQQQYLCFVLAALKDHESKTFAASPYSDPITVKLHSGMSLHAEDPEMLWVMGPVLAVVLIIIIVIAILFFK
ncbi:unnamed protein product, partial [Coregonus sp. 'balchen']